MSNEKYEELYRVVYNYAYGGFEMSKEAIKEYNLRSNKIYPTEKSGEDISRDDPVLIQLVEEMGNKINANRGSKLKIKSFPMKFKKFLNWNEYDGKESVTINHDKYLIYHIKCIIDSNIEDKIKQIEHLYKEYYESTTYKQHLIFQNSWCHI